MAAMTGFFRTLLAALLWIAAAPAWAGVTITFWSHEFGNSFPHAFFTLRGVPDAGGPPVDANYGFTAKAISPAILWGTVAGKVEPSKPNYIAGSDAQFAVVLTDEQYAAILRHVAAWDEKTGNARYNLNKRNCVHFVKEAARIAGLTDLDRPKLMKKPRSYLLSIGAANKARVVTIGQPGKVYLAGLPPLPRAPRPDPARADAPGANVGARPVAAH
jgi:hypothetical protein